MVLGIDTSKIHEESDVDEITPLLKEFEKHGYFFLHSWTMDEPVTPDRIKMPSGEILDEYELDEWFEGRKKIVGDKNQIEVLAAQEYYSLIRSLDASDRSDLYDQSFWDDKDEENCRRKYPPQKTK